MISIHHYEICYFLFTQHGNVRFNIFQLQLSVLSFFLLFVSFFENLPLTVPA